MGEDAGSKRPPSEDPNWQSEEAKLNALVEAIQTLTPLQRRRLIRRLRTSGLLDNDEVLTDRERLQVAPALGMQARQRFLHAKQNSQKPRPAGPVLVPANPPR